MQIICWSFLKVTAYLLHNGPVSLYFWQVLFIIRRR